MATNWIAFIPLNGEPYVNVGDEPHFALLEEGFPEMRAEANALASGHLPRSPQGVFAKGEITSGGYVKFDDAVGDRNVIADAVYDFLAHGRKTSMVVESAIQNGEQAINEIKKEFSSKRFKQAWERYVWKMFIPQGEESPREPELVPERAENFRSLLIENVISNLAYDEFEIPYLIQQGEILDLDMFLPEQHDRDWRKGYMGKHLAEAERLVALAEGFDKPQDRSLQEVRLEILRESAEGQITLNDKGVLNSIRALGTSTSAYNDYAEYDHMTEFVNREVANYLESFFGVLDKIQELTFEDLDLLEFVDRTKNLHNFTIPPAISSLLNLDKKSRLLSLKIENRHQLAHRGGEGPFGYGGQIATGFSTDWNFEDATEGRGGFRAAFDFFHIIAEQILNESLSSSEFSSLISFISAGGTNISKDIFLWDYLRSTKYAGVSKDYVELDKLDAKRFTEKPAQLAFASSSFQIQYFSFPATPSSNESIGEKIRAYHADPTDANFIEAAKSIIDTRIFSTNLRYVGRTFGLGGTLIEVPDYDAENGGRDPSWEVYDLTEQIHLLQEGCSLTHCIGASDEYYRYLTNNIGRHLSVRKDGVPIVTITLAKSEEEGQPTEYALSQIKSYNNGWFPFEATQTLKHLFKFLDIQILNTYQRSVWVDDETVELTPLEIYNDYLFSGDHRKYKTATNAFAPEVGDVYINDAFLNRYDTEVLGHKYYQSYLPAETTNETLEGLLKYIDNMPDDLPQALMASEYGEYQDLKLVGDPPPRRVIISGIMTDFMRSFEYGLVSGSSAKSSIPALIENPSALDTIVNFLNNVLLSTVQIPIPAGHENDGHKATELIREFNKFMIILKSSIIYRFFDNDDYRFFDDDDYFNEEYFYRVFDSIKNPTFFDEDSNNAKFAMLFEPILKALSAITDLNDQAIEEIKNYLLAGSTEETEDVDIVFGDEEINRPFTLCLNRLLNRIKDNEKDEETTGLERYKNDVEGEEYPQLLGAEQINDVYFATALAMLDWRRSVDKAFNMASNGIEFLNSLFEKDITQLSAFEIILRHMTYELPTYDGNALAQTNYTDSVGFRIDNETIKGFQQLMAITSDPDKREWEIEKTLRLLGFHEFSGDWRIIDNPNTWMGDRLTFTTQEFDNFLMEFAENSNRVMNSYYKDPGLLKILRYHYRSMGDDIPVKHWIENVVDDAKSTIEKRKEEEYGEQLELFQEIETPDWWQTDESEWRDVPSKELEGVENLPDLFFKPDLSPRTTLGEIRAVMIKQYMEICKVGIENFKTDYIVPGITKHLEYRISDIGNGGEFYRNLVEQGVSPDEAKVEVLEQMSEEFNAVIDKKIFPSVHESQIANDSLFDLVYAYSASSDLDNYLLANKNEEIGQASVLRAIEIGLKSAPPEISDTFYKFRHFINGVGQGGIIDRRYGDTRDLTLSDLVNVGDNNGGLRELINDFETQRFSALVEVMNDFGLQSPKLEKVFRINQQINESFSFSNPGSKVCILPADNIATSFFEIIHQRIENRDSFSEIVSSLIEMSPNQKKQILSKASELSEQRGLGPYAYWPFDFVPQEEVDRTLDQEHADELPDYENQPEDTPAYLLKPIVKGYTPLPIREQLLTALRLHGIDTMREYYLMGRRNVANQIGRDLEAALNYACIAHQYDDGNAYTDELIANFQHPEKVMQVIAPQYPAPTEEDDDALALGNDEPQQQHTINDMLQSIPNEFTRNQIRANLVELGIDTNLHFDTLMNVNAMDIYNALGPEAYVVFRNAYAIYREYHGLRGLPL